MQSYVYLGDETRIRVKEWQNKVSVSRGDVIQSDLPEQIFLSNKFYKVWASSYEDLKLKVQDFEFKRQEVKQKEIYDIEAVKKEYELAVKKVKEKYMSEYDC